LHFEDRETEFIKVKLANEQGNKKIKGLETQIKGKFFFERDQYQELFATNDGLQSTVFQLNSKCQLSEIMQAQIKHLEE
jgi:hypothetical protein